MQALSIVKNVKNALQNLNPREVREQAERPLSIALVGADAEKLWRMERYLCPPELSPAKRAEVSRMLHRMNSEDPRRSYDLELWDDSMAAPLRAFRFDSRRPERTINEVLAKRPDLSLPLARHFYPFRKPVIDQIISSVSKENALFSLATAIPDVIPLLSIPWALGEFASDSMFLTVNQVRMTFLIAAASDAKVGYREQKGEIGSILTGAFGFRTIARELAGKIPLGGGLIPKAAIAWAGTSVVGHSMERLYRLGYAYTLEERKSAYQAAVAKGREIASSLMAALGRRPQAT
jgi:hypothetical protein